MNLEALNIDGRTKQIVKTVLPIGIVAVGVVGLMIFGKAPEKPAPKETGDKVELVSTVAAEPYDDRFEIRVDGLTEPWREVSLAAEVGGRITKKYAEAEEGTLVEPGTKLFEIDTFDYELEVKRLTNQLAQDEARLDEMRIDLANTEELIKIAEEDVNLQKAELVRVLRSYAAKSVPASEKDRAMRAELQARNSLQTLRNQRNLQAKKIETLTFGVELTKTQLARAERDKSDATVTSPISGVIISDLVEQDDYVQMGSPLVTIEATEKIEVRTQIAMKDLDWIWTQNCPEGTAKDNPYALPKLPVDVIYELAGQEYRWRGHLSRFEGSGLDAKTRLVPVRVVCKNPARERSLSSGSDPTAGPPALVRGMYVTIAIPIEPTRELVAVPQRALRPGNKVWVDNGGKLSIRDVTVARADGERVLLYAGPSSLQAGEKVITSPLPFAFEGLKLKTAPEGRPASQRGAELAAAG